MNRYRVLSEIATNPSTLSKWASGPEAADMVVGFEAEMLISGLVWPGDEQDEEDRDMDESMPDSFSRFADDIDDWFSNGNNFHESASLRRALRMLERDYREWAGDQWESDRDDDHWQERLREEIAKELGVSEDDELVDETIENQGYAFRSAMRALKDEYIEESDGVWEEYLRINRLRLMSDFANEYNLDWPYTTSGPSSITPEELESSFVAKTGYSCIVNDDYHGSRPKNAFVMEPDSSLTGEDGYGGLELISPPMPLSTALQAVDDVFDWMEYIKARTSWRPPTGFHIGVSMGSKGIENVDKLKLILMMGDDHILKQFGREKLSRYAASSYKHIRDNLTQPGFDIESELAKFRSFLDIQASKDLGAMLSGGMRRENTVSIRPSQGYVEFRSPGGDYLKQRQEIKMAVLRFARAIAIAADPNAERKEYAKKLYQLLTAEIDKGDDAIESFAAYSSGLMSKEDLTAAIDSYRRRKGGRPDSGQRTWNVVDDATGKVLGSIVSDDDQLMDRLRSWAQRNNRNANSVNVVRPGKERKVTTYRVTQGYGSGERFDIDARTPAEALKYAKARWGAASRPDSDFTVVSRYA